MVRALILRKFEKSRSDPDPNLFRSCSDPEPDPDPNGHKRWIRMRTKTIRTHNTALLLYLIVAESAEETLERM